jgi:hypothetical protein
MITEHFAHRAPVTHSFLLDSRLYFFGISLLSGTFRHICRILSGVKTISGVPVEAERVALDESGLGLGKIPRRWMLVKGKTGGYHSRHSKIHTTFLSSLLTMLSSLFNEMS